MNPAFRLIPGPPARLQGPHGRWPCRIGRGGLRADKREGDGATPVGTWPLRAVWYRPDRLRPPATALPLRAITPADGWSDDPDDPAYNRPVRRPHPFGHEALWRRDHRYDLVVVLGHNDAPPVPGRGSAVFLHIAGTGATAGCIALARADLIALLGAAGPGSALVIARR